MISCICLDLNKETSELLEKYCSEIQFIDLQKTFQNPIEASRFIRKSKIDLIFLNTHLDDFSGFDFYRGINQDILLVFLSDFKEFAFESYNLNAVDYLLKPISLQRFNQCLNKVQLHYNSKNLSNSNEEQFLHVRSEYSLIKIALVEILYIETLDDYIKIHLLGKKPILTLMNMKTVLVKLPEKDFIRVHRSYIVAINRIESVRGKTINLGITEIPIGKSHEELFFKAYVKKGF